MPVLFAVLFGGAVGNGLARIMLSHAFLTLVVWCAAIWISIRIGYYNIGPAAGYVPGVLMPAALMAWTLWRPARSRAKLWMLGGLFVWARLGMFWFGGWAILRLINADWHLAAWIASAAPLVAAAVGFWALQRTMTGLLVRSHHREGDASCVEA